MEGRSNRPDDPERLRQKLIGLGEHSLRKSYYPQLQSRMVELERFRALLDYSKDAIFLLNAAEMTVADANQTTGLMLAEPSDNLLGRHFHELVEFDQGSSLGDLLAGGPSLEQRVAEGICRLKVTGGALLPVEFTAKLVDFADESYVVFVGRDISDRLQAAKEKEKIEKQLRHSQKMEAIGTLSGGIAHDFNNILAVIMGFAEIAYDRAQEGQADPASLRQILDSSDRAKRLVQQILAFSRKGSPDFKVLDLNRVVKDTVSLLKRTLPKMIHIQTNLADGLPPVQADPTQMEQVLLNMASNAADAMPLGGRLTIQTELTELDKHCCNWGLEVSPGVHVALLINDTGHGMSETTREHIFEPFYTTKEVGRGTGLGLSTTYGIIQSHGGHIHCYSDLGLGTTFKIYLPAFQGEAGVPMEKMPSSSEKYLRGDETVLLVDDEKGLLNLGAMTLQDMGYQVLTASSGEDALELFAREAHPPDLVVMDLGMPGMGGHMAMRAILKINPLAKVIIASGYLPQEQPRMALADGASGFLSKPFRRTDLLGKVREVLDRT